MQILRWGRVRVLTRDEPGLSSFGPLAVPRALLLMLLVLPSHFRTPQCLLTFIFCIYAYFFQLITLLLDIGGAEDTRDTDLLSSANWGRRAIV